MAVKNVRKRTRAPLQKSTQQTLKNKKQLKQVTSLNEKDKKAVVIAQEIKFARLLSSNNKVTRNRVLKNLKKWLTVRGQSSFAFTESDFLRLWKGLFYCMWISDKPLIQEELAESLSKIVHCFKTKDVVLLYTECTLRTLGTEWYGIDQYRLDKFYMLVRRIIRQTLEKCKKQMWHMEWIKGISEILEKLFIDPKICIGFSMHITEIFLEELSKVSNGNVPEEAVTEFVKPFIAYFIHMDDETQIKHVKKHIFRYLIFQSDVGMEYKEKFRAWRDAGFPTGSIDAMEKIEISDEELEDNDIEEEKYSQSQIKCVTEKPLDPRAGRVDVELPQISFDAKAIATLLTQYKFHPSSTTTSRRQVRRLINEFTELSQGNMPIGIKEIRVPKVLKKDTDTKLAAKRFLEFEKELYSDALQKKRKRKKNGQLIQDVSDTSDKNELENSDNESNIENGTIEMDENKIVKKKRKMKSKPDISDNVKITKLEISDKNSFSLKKKKCKAKEEIQNNCKTDAKSSSSKLKKNLSLLNKSTDESEKTKLKRNKITNAEMLNVTPVKRKKLTKLKITNKWDVSDNINAPTSSPLSTNSTELCTKTVEKSVTNDHVQKNDAINEQPMWLEHVLKKLENEKNKTPINSKRQHKKSISSNLKKRVKIALQRNTAQHTSEYILQIRKSPAIPFDANKKPLAGVLKASPIPSPINPFYRKNIM
ncbi:Ribosomal RNA processing protein 1 homolog [Anthophora quadrimaculata]